MSLQSGIAFQKITTKWDGGCYKEGQVLQSETGWCYKVAQVLQSGTIVTKWALADCPVALNSTCRRSWYMKCAAILEWAPTVQLWNLYNVGLVQGLEYQVLCKPNQHKKKEYGYFIHITIY